MSDEFEDPAAARDLSKLRKELRDVTGILEAATQRAERDERRSRESRQRTQTQATRESASLPPRGTTPSEATPEVQERTQQRGQRFAEARAREERRVTEELQRQEQLRRRTFISGPSGTSVGSGGEIVLAQRSTLGLTQDSVGAMQQYLQLQSRLSPLLREEAQLTRASADERIRAASASRQLDVNDRLAQLAQQSSYLREQRLQVAGTGGAGGGGRPPVLPPTAVPPSEPPSDDGPARNLNETLGMTRQQAEALDDMANSQERAAREEANARTRHLQSAVALQAETQSVERNIRALGLSGDQYRRHGALTTEFIEAARKGQVTIGELGYQITATIGKFAGWTAAATLVYGAAAAMQAAGRGALDTVEGVNNLQRVVSGINTQQAQQQLRDLAQQFNLPIGDVADAAYGMGKVFKDQDDIFKGTQAALFAVKVGELSTADATSSLTAIINGLGGSASDLEPLMDKVNNVTNQFGGNVGQLTQGLAKASGNFNAAGGSVEYLIALLETGARTSNYTANEIGTAYQRMANTIQRPDKRSQIAAQLGLTEEDAGNAEKVMESLFARVRAGASSQQIANLTSLIFTPNLAGRITNTLRNEGLFREVLGQTSTAASSGSSQRELERALRGPREELRKLITDLETLGSALASSGVLEPILGLVKGLDFAVDRATDLLEIFAQLPQPLRQGLTIIGELAAVMAVMRRFNVGGTLGLDRGSVLGGSLTRNPQAQLRAEILSGLTEESKFLQEERRRAGIGAARYSYSAQQERGRAETIRGGLDPDALDEQTRKEYDTRLARSHRYAEQAADFAADQENLAQRDADVQRQRTEIERRTGLRRKETVEAVARDVGVEYAPGTLERPAPQQPVPVGQRPTPVRPVTTGYGAIVPPAVQQSLANSEQAATRAAGEMGQAQRRIQRLQPVLTGLGSRATAFAGSLRNMGTAIVSSIGPLDAVLIGALALFEAYQIGQQRSAEARARITDLNRLPASTANLAAIRKQADQELGQKSLFDRVQDSFAEMVNRFTPGNPVQSPDQAEDAAAKRALREADTIARSRNSGVALSQKEITDRYAEALKAAGDDTKAIEQARNDALKEVGVSQLAIYGTGSAREKALLAQTSDYIKQRARDLLALKGDVEEALKNASADELEDVGKTLTTDVKARGLGGGGVRLDRLSTAIAQAFRSMAGASTEDLDTILSTIDSLESAGLDRLQTVYEQRTAHADPAQRRRASQRYLASARRLLLGGPQKDLDELVGRQADASSEIARLQSELDRDPTYNATNQTGTGAGAFLPNAPSPFANQGLSDSAKAKVKRIDALKTRNKADADQEKELRRQLGLNEEQYQALVEQVRRDDYEADLSSYDARTSRLQSETADPRQQASIARQRIHERTEKVREAVRKGLATHEELNEAIQKENETTQADVAAALSELQSQQSVDASSYNLANPFDQRGQLTNARSQAQQFYAAVKAQGDQADPNTLRSALESLNQTKLAIVQYDRDQAKALLDAQEAYATSGTEDPVQQAKIAAEYAQRRLRFATTPAEKLQAQADVRTKSRDYKQAQQQDQYDTLRLSYDLDKIDQQSYIERLTALRNRLKGNKQLRDQIDRELASLKKEIAGQAGDLSLNTDSLKLPTVYEIRRAIRGAQTARGASVAQNNNNVFNVTITDRSGAEEFGRQLEQGVGIARVNLRAAGVIG